MPLKSRHGTTGLTMPPPKSLKGIDRGLKAAGEGRFATDEEKPSLRHSAGDKGRLDFGCPSGPERDRRLPQAELSNKSCIVLKHGSHRS